MSKDRADFPGKEGLPDHCGVSSWLFGSGIAQQGDDWVLQSKLGDIPIAVVLIGTASS